MNRFWEMIIEPSINRLNAKKIVEIGIDEGKNTKKLLKYCKQNGAYLYGVDPAPRVDVEAEFKEYKDHFIYLNELSLNAIGKIPEFDTILIDGDHNWYTVYNELKLIRKTCKKFPVVFFHDISWPYARRDLYYNPDNIPKGYLNAYAKKGIDIDGSNLLEKGGMNSSFNNCIYENAINNGVLTAIEDFIEEQKEELEFMKIMIFNGLGILYHPDNVSREFVDFIKKFKICEELNEFLVKADKTIAREHIQFLDEKYNREHLKEKNILLDERCCLVEEQNTELHYELGNIKLTYEKVSSQNEELAQKNEELTQKNEELTQKNEELTQKNEELTQKSEELCVSVEELEEEKENKNRECYQLKNEKARLECAFSELKEKNDIQIKEIKHREDVLVQKVSHRDKDNQVLKDSLNIIYRNKKKVGYRYVLKNIIKRSLKSTLINIKGIKAIRKEGDFDYGYYLLKNPDIRKSNIDPLVHYIWFGGYEGRDCSLNFDTNFYNKRYLDVQTSQINPLVHYHLYGKFENRGCVSTNSVTILQSKVPMANESMKLLTNGSKVSIIMPTWNRANVIRNAVDSILSQGYQDFEIIIVDDNSKDETESIIKKQYSKELQLGKIKYIKSTEQLGVCKARNVALSNSTGEYIAYLDSDNTWRPNYLAEMMNVFKSNPQYACAYCDEEVNNNIQNIKKIRSSDYDRKALITQNFIDLNVFMHKRLLYLQYGGFDENLRRLVDWDLIARYTKYNKPYHLRKVLVDYYIDKELNNISHTVSLEDNYNKVAKKHRRERAKYGVDQLNIAYILWDFPAGSQTFVFNEIKNIMKKGYNVKIYYKVIAQNARKLDFDIEAYQVDDYKHLAKLLVEHDIDMMHTHFVYPTGTLLTYEASKLTNIPFTLVAHAVDIFHHANDKRNKIAEMAAYNKCEKILVPGEYHFHYLVERGVPSNKIIVANQSINQKFMTSGQAKEPMSTEQITITAIGRFIEKKGFEYLIESAHYLKENVRINIYGYGDLEDEYRKLIKQYNVEDFVFIKGELCTPEEVIDVYKKSDLLVAPCVVAENGDIDGMPTVILEAMGMGVPIVATSVSSIPYMIRDNYNGFIVEPRNAKKLAAKINEIVNMDKVNLKRIMENAKETIEILANKTTMENALVDIWREEALDIFMVTYCEDGNIEETKQIITNLYNNTVSKFTLTIIDNHSCSEMVNYLNEVAVQNDNIRLVTLPKNIMCGPASNMALSMIDGKYAIYICSNEGYVLRTRWEQDFLNCAAEHKQYGMIGAAAYSTKFYDRESYKKQEWFKDFRNSEMIERMDGYIKHIQGGIFMLNMEAYRKVGGFSSKFPQGLMDVEYSYYLESCGYTLEVIPTVLCGTKKTLPKPSYFVDETIGVVHPFNVKEYREFKKNKDSNKCCVCNSYVKFNDGVCPECHSSVSDRVLYKYLSQSCDVYRKLIINTKHYDTECSKIKFLLEQMFSVVNRVVEEESIMLCNNVESITDIREYINVKKIIFIGDANEEAQFEIKLTKEKIRYIKKVNKYYSKMFSIANISAVEYVLD